MTNRMQVAYPSDGYNAIRVEVPAANRVVLPGLLWGEAGGLFTPAYWAVNSKLFATQRQHEETPHRLGRTLAEETAACLLGGYGMPAEIGLAAFNRLRDRKLLFPGVTPTKLEAALLEAFKVVGRVVHYRFPRQKAQYLAACLTWLDAHELSLTNSRALRDELTKMPGVGPKTASWIVRNWLDVDDLAILDVHIIKALRLLGLVDVLKLPRDYEKAESIFVRLANRLGVRASVLDAVMWEHMRRWGHLIERSSYELSSRETQPHRQEFQQLALVSSGDD